MSWARRLSDEDRDLAAKRLRDAFIRGVLPQEEFDSRVEAALSAATTDDLSPLLNDLPAVHPQRREEVRFAVSGGHVERLGEWDIPRRIVVEALSAAIILDFRATELVDGRCEIDVVARKSKLSLLVPANMAVDADSLGRHRSKIRDRRRVVTDSSVRGVLTLSGDMYVSSLRIVSPD